MTQNADYEGTQKRPILCRLGLHQWYTDGAFFTTVRRCNRCGAPSDAVLAADLDHERRLWSSGPQGESFVDGMVRVGDALSHNGRSEA